MLFYFKYHNIPTSTYKISTATHKKLISKAKIIQQQEIVYKTCKFIFNATIGSGKNTTLMVYIKEINAYNYIIVVLTVNIANYFYNTFHHSKK